MRDLVLELAVGLALMGLGFGIPWLFVGERALDYTGMTAWGKGDAVTGPSPSSTHQDKDIERKPSHATLAQRVT